VCIHACARAHAYIYMYIMWCVCVFIYTYTREQIYTGCPGRNVPDFGIMFLKLKYTDLTKNTYIQS